MAVAGAVYDARMLTAIYPLTIKVNNAKPIEYTDDNVSVAVHGGDTVEMSIPEKRLGGYQWMPDMDDATKQQLTVTKDEYTVPYEPGKVDQVGIHTITFMVAPTAALPLKMALSLRHWWVPDSKPVEQKQIELKAS
jgi:hypothetical protein